jgi:GWxTD domain-containing protein
MFSRKVYRSVFIMTLLIAFAAMVSSCGITTVAPDANDISFIYNPTKNIFSPEFTVFHENAEKSTLSVKIRKSQLFFTEANPTGVPMASIRLSVRLYDNNLGGVLCDSATYDFDVKRDDVAVEFVCRVPLKAYDGVSYYGVVRLYDKVRNEAVRDYFSFEKSESYDAGNYRIAEHFSKRELFTRTLHSGEYVNILYPKKEIDTLCLFYFRPVTGISPAPSIMLPEVTATYEPDKIFKLPYSDTLPVMFPREGIYLFSIDSTIQKGITLFNFGQEYPTMISAETMIPPLAYIATEEEMIALKSSLNHKIALDDFWMNRAGNIEKAKELIRIYYYRVQYANLYFTSYKYGWLTDRGMIYVVYGPPDKLYKNADTEKWGYKMAEVKSRWGSRYPVENQYMWFIFKKQENKFTENDYTLNRAQTPVSYWDQAVASWRRGSVFRLDNPKGLQ